LPDCQIKSYSLHLMILEKWLNGFFSILTDFLILAPLWRFVSENRVYPRTSSVYTYWPKVQIWPVQKFQKRYTANFQSVLAEKSTTARQYLAVFKSESFVSNMFHTSPAIISIIAFMAMVQSPWTGDRLRSRREVQTLFLYLPH
jgi:hypothetical protein